MRRENKILELSRSTERLDTVNVLRHSVHAVLNLMVANIDDFPIRIFTVVCLVFGTDKASRIKLTQTI